MRDFTKKQTDLIRSIQALRETYPREELDDPGALDRQYRILRDLGIITFMVPRRLGGGGGDVKTYCLILEELARISGSLSLLALSQMAASVGLRLSVYPSTARKYLQRQVHDERFIISMAMTEPQAGSDISSIRTKATRDGNRYVLSGEKCLISNGSWADVLFVFAKPEDFRDLADILIFAVEKGAEGFKVERDDTKLGLKGSPVSVLHFENVLLPREQVLADGRTDGGRGFKNMMAGLNISRLGAGAIALGLASAAVDAALRFLREREDADTSMVGEQGLKCVLADGEARTEAIRALIFRTAAMIDRREGNAVKAASVAKYFSTETAMKVTSDIHRVFGPSMSDMGSLLRDVTCLLILEGTSQVHQLLIARELMKNKGI